MKKTLLALLAVITLTLAACVEQDPSNDQDPSNGQDQNISEPSQLSIFYTNDVHGAILPDGGSMGLAYMANLMTTHKENHPDNTLILDGGDALQGGAISNYYEGESYIEIMNAMKYDALVVGNHEFDWGLETVTRYFDPDHEKGIAEFPLLGANIIVDETGEIPEHVDPYTVVERAGRTIGIIGTIGYGLESSIAPSAVEGYSFLDPAPIVEEHAKTLRSEEGADLVLLLTHDSGNVNDEVLEFGGDAKVDAIFNSHSHQTFAYVEDQTAIIQSGGYGSHVGEVTFSWDEYGLSGINARNLREYDRSELSEPHPEVKAVIDGYVDETDEIFNDPIIENPVDLGRGELSHWIADLMRHATDADIGIQNDGGTRNAMPSGDITLGGLYDIWPFENEIKTVELEGSVVSSLTDAGYLTHATDISTFEDGSLYKVATNDFVFDQEDNPFLYGENPEETDLYIRDLAEEELRLQSGVYDHFDTDNPFLFERD